MDTTLTSAQRKTAWLVLIAAGCALTYGVMAISWALAYIVALPALLGYALWYRTYLRKPTNPAFVLPPFMLAVAAFELHLIEEYRGGYPLAISRIFDFAWTDFAFFATICGLAGALMLVCLGLYYQKPVAGFLAILFLLTRLAELALFIFPYVSPAHQPDNPAAITASIHGTLMAKLPNYYYPVTHQYYFPGMYTVGLVLLPTVYTLYRMLIYHNRRGYQSLAASEGSDIKA